MCTSMGIGLQMGFGFCNVNRFDDRNRPVCHSRIFNAVTR